MAKGVNEIVVKNWQHFVGLTSIFDIGSPLGQTYIFRGQARADWPLTPSLVRGATSAALNSQQTLVVEKAALKEFQAQAHLYLPGQTIHEKEDLLSWWALMQHYNAPTRLLDWTSSPFVAAYFAVAREPHHSGAVWTVHPHTIMEYMKRTYPGYEVPRTLGKTVEIFLNPNAEAVLYFVAPLTQTDRMGAQQTSSTVSAQVLMDHGKVIADALPEQTEKELYCKLIIPETLKLEFLRRLRQINITARALFPGVDGLGRSIAELVTLAAVYESGKG